MEAKEIYSTSPSHFPHSLDNNQNNEVLKFPIKAPDTRKIIPEEIQPYEEFW